jgi:hypothetical protein
LPRLVITHPQEAWPHPQAEVARKKGLCRTWMAKVECCEIGLDVVGLVKLCGVYGLRAADVIGVMGKAP